MSSLEDLYTHHHSTKRGEGFVLLEKERAAFLKKHIGTGKKVVDIGCRDGALTAHYMKGNNVLGLDIDSKALERAVTKGIQTKHIDLNGDWEVEQKSTDIVVAAEVIEHLYYPEIVIEKITKILKDDGILIGTVPNAFSLAHRARYFRLKKKNTPLEDPTHINHFTVKELEELLESYFKEVKIKGVGRLGWLAEKFPQLFAFDLFFVAKYPR